jgi:glycine betaine catabolism A
MTVKRTLPAKFYVDPAYFQEELTRFFLNTWICNGRTETVARSGEYFLTEIAGESLITVKTNEGSIRTFYNVCRHRGTRLCETPSGKFSGIIQCPYHAWTYGLDGRLSGAPQMQEVADFSLQDYSLTEVATEVWDGNLFINLSSNPSPLSRHLGALKEKFRPWAMENLKLGHRILYDVEANWKLLVQNYSECLHCPVIHPALQKLSHYLSGENEPAHPTYLGGRMVLKPEIKTMTMDGTTQREPLAGLSEEERRHVYYYWLLPNLLISAHPDYVVNYLLWPIAHNRTKVTCEFHFSPEAMARPDFNAMDAVAFWDLTNRQDWKVSELSQLGISSRAYVPGPYSPRESLLSALDDLVRGGSQIK